ncbi:hypothetical protein BX600DRAFT_510792 [Xylariales sp. PMI_506]|nr:hypothetical protein BX600DRAFT_510792 [Xylariales sp. PMI_506]
MDVEEPLLIFRAQYLQCLDPDFLRWPPVSLLRQSDAQRFLYKYLFDSTCSPHKLPPTAYRLETLTALMAKLQKIADTEMASEKPFRDLTALQAQLEAAVAHDAAGYISHQDGYRTYNCALPGGVSGQGPQNLWLPITLHERRSLISGSRFTGHRTWEGAMHLAWYLLLLAGGRLDPNAPNNSSGSSSSSGAGSGPVVAGKTVLELGAGTGFLSILCARYLGAARVLSTDGDAEVVRGIGENLLLNDLAPAGGREAEVVPVVPVVARRLFWGKGQDDDGMRLLAKEVAAGKGFDIVMGADLIYNHEATTALVETLRLLLDLQPNAKVIISCAIRFPDVFAAFETGCEINRLKIIEVEFQSMQLSRQKSLFYSTAMPLRILEISNY